MACAIQLGRQTPLADDMDERDDSEKDDCVFLGNWVSRIAPRRLQWRWKKICCVEHDSDVGIIEEKPFVHVVHDDRKGRHYYTSASQGSPPSD